MGVGGKIGEGGQRLHADGLPHRPDIHASPGLFGIVQVYACARPAEGKHEEGPGAIWAEVGT